MLAIGFVSAVSVEDVPYGKSGILTPDHPLYFLDNIFDELTIKFYEAMRALRLISDEDFSKRLLDVVAERKAELSYLEQKGQIETKMYQAVNRSMHEWLNRYSEYVKPKLEVSYDVEGCIITLVVKNVWDREIGYVTGGYEVRNIETGKTISMKSPLAYPLNLRPGKERVYRITIPPEYAGTWIVNVEVYTRDGQKLIRGNFELSIPG